MLREVVKYGEALTTQDQPSIRSTLHTSQPNVGGSARSANPMYTQATETRGVDDRADAGGADAGDDAPSIAVLTSDARAGDASSTGTATVHTLTAGRDDISARTHAADGQGTDVGGEASSTSAMHTIGEHAHPARTAEFDKGDLREGDVVRGGGGRGRSLLQAPLQPSISAVFRIVCKNISVAMSVQV